MLLLRYCNGRKQDRPYKVVFDLTSSDTTQHKAVLRWINEIMEAHPDAQLEVVYYGQSLDMVTKGKSQYEEAVKKWAANKNVGFIVCEVALKNHKLEKGDLIPGVMTVPDGIYEIISKQAEGWGYIKAAGLLVDIISKVSSRCYSVTILLIDRREQVLEPEGCAFYLQISTYITEPTYWTMKEIRKAHLLIT